MSLALSPLQSVKCLVFLCTHMHDDDDAAGKLPLPLRPSGGSVGGAANGGAANGDAAANGAAAEHEEEEEEEKLQEEPAGGSEGEEEEEEGGSGDEEEVAADADEVAAEASAAEEAAAGSLTLRGLVRRMVRVAEDKTFAKQMQRGAALRFIAAVASRLGAERAQPFLPLLMRPLYRITEPGGRASRVGGRLWWGHGGGRNHASRGEVRLTLCSRSLPPPLPRLLC